MTKEELLCNIRSYAESEEELEIFDKFVNEFFDSNVCIPKGENRHEYADVLHEWVEGAEVEFSLKGQWISFSNINDVYTEGVRIKPSEPIYEWQWYDIDRNREVFIVNRGHFMTEDESGELTTFGKMRKFEETKRERK